MHLKITRERVIELISAVQSVIERKHVLNILSNIRIALTEDEICMTGTDLEVELVARAKITNNECKEAGVITLPAKKLFDICKALQPNSLIDLKTTEDGRCIVKSNQSKFAIGTLPAEDYPSIKKQSHSNENTNLVTVFIGTTEFKRLFDKTAFSMAVQDVRFYLTGTLLEIESNLVRAVTTDGHRLATCEAVASTNNAKPMLAILPKKAVGELQRLLQNGNKQIQLTLGRELVSASLELETKEGSSYSIEFTTKMIDGKYPDYRRVIPNHQQRVATVNIEDFKRAIQRVSILSNEKDGCIIINFTNGEIKLSASNRDQDEAYEYLDVSYDSDEIEIAFNAQYLSDILNCLDSGNAEIRMNSNVDSVLILDPMDLVKKYLVMPRRT